MIKSITVALALMLTGVGVAYAGSLTQGLDVAGGKNTFAQLALERADLVESEEGVIRLQMTVSEAQELKGSVDGSGALVEFVFRSTEDPLAADFQIAEGVLVDFAGQIDQIHNIEVGNLSLRPDDFGLAQNVPNPFNPSTTIDYQMPEAGEVRLTVYNLLGQEIRTLIDGQLDAGYHTIVWDGMDDAGRQVASGVYVYRMHSGNFSAIRRMMLLK